MTAVVEFKRVQKSFPAHGGRIEVLRRIDFLLQPGEFVAVTGPSGSGKSTLLNLAALLDQPSAGTLMFDGHRADHLSESSMCDFRKHGVGMVFQKYCLLPHRTVLENVLFRFRYVQDKPDDARRQAHEVLDMMGLADVAERPARLLSGGEMQRVAIARAVVLPPRLLVADEPTGNLDRRASLAVMDCFQQLNRQGLTILLVTHNESLLDYCSRHLVCADGFLNQAA